MKLLMQYITIFGNLLLMCNRQASAQQKPSEFKYPNTIYLEVKGANLVYSLNYDRLIIATMNRRYLFGYRIGGSLWGKRVVESRLIGEFYALTGKHKNHLELGIGSSFGRNWNYGKVPYGSSINVLFSPTIAYRFQDPNGISFFRVGMSRTFPINGLESNISSGLLLGIGFGRSF